MDSATRGITPKLETTATNVVMIQGGYVDARMNPRIGPRGGRAEVVWCPGDASRNDLSSKDVEV